jgi:hypothetical protein
MLSLKYNQTSNDLSEMTERATLTFRRQFVGPIKTVQINKHFESILRPKISEHKDPTTEMRRRNNSIRVVGVKNMIDGYD